MGDHFQRAQLLIEQSRYELAEQELTHALASNPNHPGAHALMAFCFLHRELYAQATESAERAVGLAPDLPMTHYTLAHVWNSINDLNKAEEAIEQAIELDPYNPNYYAFHGAIHFQRSRWQSALEAAEEALAIDPEHTDAINLRASSLRNLGHKDSAEAELAGALRLDPDDSKTHANMGWNYLEKSDLTKAMEHFKEALRLDPELEWARKGVIETLKAKNVLYRQILKFFLWMNKKSTEGQWKFILGIYIAFLIARKMATLNPTMYYVLLPFIVAYLVFVVITWLAVPLSNLALRMHPFGQLALSRDEKIGSNWVGGFLFTAMVTAIIWLNTGSENAKELAIFFGLMVIPLSMTFLCKSPWPRKGMIIYTLIVGCCGVLYTTILIINNLENRSFINWPAFLFNLLVLFMKVAPFVYYLGAVFSVWMANILLSIRWKK